MINADLLQFAEQIQKMRTLHRPGLRVNAIDADITPPFAGGTLNDDQARNVRIALGHLRSAEALLRMAAVE